LPVGDNGAVTDAPQRLSDGLWRWTARHPEWHPGEFGAEVASFAVEAGEDLLLIDPMLPAEEAPVLELLDGLAEGRETHALITIGYHVRSAESLCARYGGRIFGPKTCASRLEDAAKLTVWEPGVAGPAGVVPFAIGKPQRTERPLWIPSHRAIAFGDAVVVNPEGQLCVWSHEKLDDKRLRWYSERFAPTLEPLLDLPSERILVTHGKPVLRNGGDALREAVHGQPWYHHG
jgi:hypothetical protein